MKNPLNQSLTLVKGLFGYAQQGVSLNELQTTKYCINELTELWMLMIQIILYMTHQKHLKNSIA